MCAVGVRNGNICCWRWHPGTQWGVSSKAGAGASGLSQLRVKVCRVTSSSPMFNMAMASSTFHWSSPYLIHMIHTQVHIHQAARLTPTMNTWKPLNAPAELIPNKHVLNKLNIFLLLENEGGLFSWQKIQSNNMIINIRLHPYLNK